MIIRVVEEFLSNNRTPIALAVGTLLEMQGRVYNRITWRIVWKPCERFQSGAYSSKDLIFITDKDTLTKTVMVLSWEGTRAESKIAELQKEVDDLKEQIRYLC